MRLSSQPKTSCATKHSFKPNCSVVGYRRIATYKFVYMLRCESDALSKDLKKRGFTFVGSTILYAFMQATGLVNDHLLDCFRYEEIRGMG